MHKTNPKLGAALPGRGTIGVDIESRVTKTLDHYGISGFCLACRKKRIHPTSTPPPNLQPPSAKTTMSETSPACLPPAKRVKLDEPAPASVPTPIVQTQTFSQIGLERAVGITEYIDADLQGWRGILKQRYVGGFERELSTEMGE